MSAVKEEQQKYCETVYSRSGINHMWIKKNSKDLLDNIKSRSFSQIASIKTFDFSTIYIFRQPIKKPVRTLSMFMSMAFVKDANGISFKNRLKGHINGRKRSFG
jgi:hypothetical protein